MKTFSLWLLLVAACLGAETAAWKVSLKRAIWQGLDHPLVTKLEKPPGESAFFKDGDELWDVSQLLEWRKELPGGEDVDPFSVSENGVGDMVKFAGEWAVWNGRSRMIIARGDWQDLGMVEMAVKVEDAPLMLKTQVDLLDPKGELIKRMAVLSRSGEQGRVTSEGMEVEVTAHKSFQSRWADILLHVSRKNAGGHVDMVDTRITLPTGKPITFARRIDGDQGWEMKVEVEVLTTDGRPVSELRWIERNGRIEVADVRGAAGGEALDRGKAQRLKLPDGMKLRVMDLPAGMVEAVTGRRFAGWWPWFPEVELPDQLAILKGRTYLDVREDLKEQGIKFEHPLAMAGYDLRNEQIVLVTDEVGLDLFEAIFLCMYDPPIMPCTLEVEGFDASTLLLICSGEKSSITRKDGEKVTKLLEAALNLGANGEVIDVQYDLNSADGRHSLKAAATVASGVPMKIGSFQNGGIEDDITLTVTAGEE